MDDDDLDYEYVYLCGIPTEAFETYTDIDGTVYRCNCFDPHAPITRICPVHERD